MAKEKIFVTGAGGFIGSHLTERLVEKGYRVKAFVRYNSKNSWGWINGSPCSKDIEIVSGDIRNYDFVKYAMKGVDAVLHLAALIGIPYSYVSPDTYVDTNVRGTLNILQAAKELGGIKVIHTSTSEVYGTAKFVPINEGHPLNPQSPYAATKVAADALALSFYYSFDLPVIVLRPFNSYGPRQSARAVIPTIITQILDKNNVIKLGSLFPLRDLTFVKDTVEGYISALESNNCFGEVINIGFGADISIEQLAFLIAKMMNVNIEIAAETERMRSSKSEVARLLADNKKAKELLGWQPRYSLEAGLRETITWFSSNYLAYKSNIFNI